MMLIARQSSGPRQYARPVPVRRFAQATARLLAPVFTVLLAGCAMGTPAAPGGEPATDSAPTSHPLAFTAPKRPAMDTRNEVRFVIWGDTQFDLPPVFERLVYETALLRPHFVVQVGDLITGYTDDETKIWREWQRYFQQIAPLDAPFYPVPGNHDVVTPATNKIYGEVWGQDRYFYSFEHGPVLGIVLNSFAPGANDRITTEQQAWLEQTLSDYASRHGGIGSPELISRSIFVFLHSPLWRYAPDKPGRADWEAVHGLLKDYPVRLVAAGHTHEHVHEVRDGINYLVLNSAGRLKSPANERGGFLHTQLHVSVRGGNDVRYATIRAGSILPLDTIDSEDRLNIGPLSFNDTTIRLGGWETGQPLETTFTTNIENNSDRPRTVAYEWKFPRAAHGVVDIEPLRGWVDLESSQTLTTTFTVRTSAVPAGRANQPWLEIRAEETLPTRVVPRQEEASLRARIEQAKSDEQVIRPAIVLDQKYDYTARQEIYSPPVARAARWTGAPPTLDGRLDEPAWSRAMPITDFLDADGNQPAVGTEVRILYGSDHLYVGARLGEPNPAGLKASASGDIAMTWNDDDLELFFHPTNTLRDHTRLFLNSAGTRFSAYPQFVPGSRYFNARYRSAIHIDDDHWAVEMEIPWSDTWPEGQAPQPGDAWAFLVARHRQQSSPARISWRGLGLYGISRYGELRFE